MSIEKLQPSNGKRGRGAPNDLLIKRAERGGKSSIWRESFIGKCGGNTI